MSETTEQNESLGEKHNKNLTAVSLVGVSKSLVNNKENRIEYGKTVQSLVNFSAEHLNSIQKQILDFGQGIEPRMKGVMELASKIVELEQQNVSMTLELKQLEQSNEALFERLKVLDGHNSKFNYDFSVIAENINKEESLLSIKQEQLAKLQSELADATAKKEKLISKSNKMYLAVVISSVVALVVALAVYIYLRNKEKLLVLI